MLELSSLLHELRIEGRGAESRQLLCRQAVLCSSSGRPAVFCCLTDAVLGTKLQLTTPNPASLRRGAFVVQGGFSATYGQTKR